MNATIPTAMWFDDRFYKVHIENDEYIIASVTTNLGIEEKPFLLKWYADLGWDEARKRLGEAGERGKRIHFALWCYMNKGAVIYNPPQSPFYTDDEIQEIKKRTGGLYIVLKDQGEMVAVWKLQQFFEIVKPKILHTEMTVFSVPKEIAGTLDIALLIEKGVYPVNGSRGLVIPETGTYLVDLKSGNMVSEQAWAQIGAYAEAWEDMGMGPVLGGIVLHTSALTKKGIAGFSAELLTRMELRPHYEIYQHLAAVYKARNPNAGPVAFKFPTLIEKTNQ